MPEILPVTYPVGIHHADGFQSTFWSRANQGCCNRFIIVRVVKVASHQIITSIWCRNSKGTAAGIQLDSCLEPGWCFVAEGFQYGTNQLGVVGKIIAWYGREFVILRIVKIEESSVFQVLDGPDHLQFLGIGQQTGWYVLIVCLIVYFFMVIIAAWR